MITIVTDSTAYISSDEARALGTCVVPMNYTVNGMPYQETYTDRNGGFVRLLGTASSPPTTSQVSVPAFTSAFEQYTRGSGEVVCVTISSRLSGTYGSAVAAARETRGKVAVVDSLTTAGGIYLLILEARRLADSGMNADEIASALETVRDEITTVFSVEDMNPLRRSGRIGIVRQSVGTMLNIKPILRCSQGAVVSECLARGKTEQLRALTALMPEKINHALVHSFGGGADAQALYNEIARTHPEAELGNRTLGPVLGVHLGLGVLAAVWRA